MKTKFFIITLFIASSACATSFLQGLGKSQHQLSQVSQKIHSLESELNDSKTQKSQLQEKLQTSETAIGQIEKSLKQTNQKLKTQLQLLTQTQTERDALQTEIQNQQVLLQEYIRAAYMLGRQQGLKIVLNQQDPAKIGRYMEYYRYLVLARNKTIEKIKTNTQTLEKTLIRIQQETDELRKIKIQQEQQRTALQHAQNNRKSALSKINHSISSHQAQLTKLYSDKTRLQALLKTLSTERQTYLTSGANFAEAKGHLPWPVSQIDIIQGYHELIAQNRMRSTGLLLKAPGGTNVHAIYGGKIVFAHWLRGFGLLLIIQHGRSFMSLYGRCQSLYVQEGDAVKAGQTIATVGNSGGYPMNALYFELRHGSNPIDPFRWLKKIHG